MIELEIRKKEFVVTNKRDEKTSITRVNIKDIPRLVDAMDILLSLGVVCLPKQIYLYRNAVSRAFAGDLVALKQALHNVQTRNETIVKVKSNNPTLVKWQTNMSSSLEVCFYQLSMLYQLLGEYHAQQSNTTKPLSAKTSRSCNRKGNTLVRKSRLHSRSNHK